MKITIYPNSRQTAIFAADVFATKTQLYMEEIKVKQVKTNISLSAFL